MKRTLALCLMASSPLWSPGEASSQDNFPEPPAVYVDKGACPGECCAFRRWSVLKDAALFDKPGGTRVVGVVKKGEWVKGLTGSIYISPTRLKVVYTHVSSFVLILNCRIGLEMSYTC